MRTISNEERRRRIGRRHLLAPHDRVDDVPAVADAVVALHSSDPVTVYLSIAARSHRATPAAIERALYDDRTVIRHHAMRRTLWVMTPAVAMATHAACTRKIADTERRRTARLAGDADWLDRAVDEVVELVAAADEPLSTRRIGELRPDLRRDILFGAGTKHESRASAHTRAALVAAFDGSIVRARPPGSWINSQYGWTAADRWIDIDWDAHDERSGAAELVHRWLDRYGPGTLDDIVWWTGSTKRLVRSALAAVGAEEVALDDGTGFALADDTRPSDDPGPWVAMLPGLDPTPMGWKGRAWYLDDRTTRRVVDRFGNIGPTIWADGRIIGGWVQRPDGEIAVELTTDVGAVHRRMLDAEIGRLRQFLGGTRFKVRFPSPNQRDLLG